MSGSALMTIGKTALFANYAALQTAGNNIANVNTTGYSRQEAQFETSQGQFTGSGFFGKGVSVATVTRAYNELLTQQAVASKSVAAADTLLPHYSGLLRYDLANFPRVVLLRE